jgi:hypothetical protein
MFDLWAAICIAVSRIILPKRKPNWSQLTATVGLLTKVEKRKLVLKYHPDKLLHVLGRVPTICESNMSTIAMSALNLLFSDSYLEEKKSIMATMSQLDALYTKYLKSQKENKPPKEPKAPKEPKEPKEPNASKRKPTAYNNFVKITIPIIKAEHLYVTGKGELMKLAAAKWKELSTEEKAAFA